MTPHPAWARSHDKNAIKPFVQRVDKEITRLYTDPVVEFPGHAIATRLQPFLVQIEKE